MTRSVVPAAVLAAIVVTSCTAGPDPASTVPMSQAAQAHGSTVAASAPPPTTTLPAVTITMPATTTAPPKVPIILGFAGDVSFTNGLDTRDPLGDVTTELAAPDFMAVNLETTVAEPDVGTRVDKEFTFKSPPDTVDLLAAAGIDAVQLANNHTLDFMRPALLRTIDLLDGGGLLHAGAGTDPVSAYAPTFFDVGDWRVGLVAFSRVPCDWSASGQNTRPEVAWTCDAFTGDALDAVAAAATGADLVVVMVHWGLEGDHCPQPFQRELATAWAGAGADLVVGGHPHVLQGVERIGDTWLVNSTGNFAFPSARDATARSAVFEFTVSEGGIDLQVVPVRITAGRPALAAGEDAASILADLGRWSSGYRFDTAGNAVPTAESGAC